MDKKESIQKNNTKNIINNISNDLGNGNLNKIYNSEPDQEEQSNYAYYKVFAPLLNILSVFGVLFGIFNKNIILIAISIIVFILNVQEKGKSKDNKITLKQKEDLINLVTNAEVNTLTNLPAEASYKEFIEALKNHFDKTVSMSNFTYKTAISVDDKSKEFYLMENKRVFKFDYNKLTNFEYFEDGKMIMSGKSGSTIIGGLTFGLFGALVGSSGERKQKQYVNIASIKIYLNDLQNSIVTLNLIGFKLEKGSSDYHTMLRIADEMLGILNYIKHNQN